MTVSARIHWIFRGFCACALGMSAIVHAQPSNTPTLTFLIDPSGQTDPACFAVDQEVVVAIHVGPSLRIINGGQFLVLYDPTCLRFESAAPAGPPYTNQIAEIVNEPAGTIFYAVGVKLGGMGVAGDADMAVLSFTALGDCASCELCFGEANPLNTILVDDLGQPVLVTPFCSSTIRPDGALTMTVPEDVVVVASCSGTSVVAWSAPTASAHCDGGGAELSCVGVHVDTGTKYPDEIVQLGGELPLGVSNFCCTAADECGAEEEACWSVGVFLFLPPRVDPAGVPKNRYLSIFPGNSQQRTALRVTLVELDRFPEANGTTRWVGPPVRFTHTVNGETAWAAPLQCTAHFQTWDSDELLHVFGAEIVPHSVYVIDAIGEGCPTIQVNQFSPPIVLATSQWGDVVATFGRSNFADVTAVVDSFLHRANAPPKTQAQLQPRIVNPLATLSFADVSQAVDAFRTLPYPFSGPGVCP